MKSQKPIFFLLLLSLVISLPAQDYKIDVLTHTFSIVARDPQSGDLGVAVQSHWFSVGSIVSWAEAGVGAIATQSLVNVSFGPRGLELLRQGKSAEETLDTLIAAHALSNNIPIITNTEKEFQRVPKLRVESWVK